MSTFHSQARSRDVVGRLLQSAWRYKALIAAAMLLGALLGYGWAARQPTLYEGTSWVFIANGCPTDVLCRPLRDHAQLMRSPPVLERAIKLNGSRISADALRQRLQVDVAWSAHVIRIRVADSTAKGAAQLANAVPAAYQQVVAPQARKVADQLSRARSELKTSLAETEAELVRNPNDPRLRAQRTAVADELSQVQRRLRAAHHQVLRKLAAAPKQPIISPSPGRAMVIGMLVGLLAAAVLVWWRTRRQGPTSRSSPSEPGPEMPSPA
jgi:capsular polysaccharide biosynthesis protein